MATTDLPPNETLTVEFKSDLKRLPDDELVETLVCLANTEGGAVFLGVEDDGTATGLHAAHQDTSGLAAMVANRTSPALAVTVELMDLGACRIARVVVPKSHRIVSTTAGVIKRRRLDAKGRPECVPLLPHEIPTRLSDLGAFDASRHPVPGATLADLDPAERARLRQFVERYQGDRSLVELSDDELDGALSLVARDNDARVPTLAGLLLIGREASLRKLVPTHEVAFQVLDGEAVRVNEFSRAPLLRIFEWLDALFTPINVEQELQVGLFRVSVPRLDRSAFREAVANALTHRDYTRLGPVYVRFDSDGLTVSNPGGFVEGVTTENLLTTEPHPRNPTLADAFKRAGIVERTGRGVDLIYRGLLRYGRPLPDYSRSTSTSVVLRMSASDADMGFLRMVVDAEQRRGGSLPVDSLIALACLRDHRRATAEEIATAIQKGRVSAKQTLEALVEAGLAQAHGNTKGRAYTLASRIYTQAGRAAEYARQAGFTRIQQEQMVLNLARETGALKRSDVAKLCQLSDDQATRLLKGLVEKGSLVATGRLRWRRYHLGGGAS